jgi:DnaK suppressor protein
MAARKKSSKKSVSKKAPARKTSSVKKKSAASSKKPTAKKPASKKKAAAQKSTKKVAKKAPSGKKTAKKAASKKKTTVKKSSKKVLAKKSTKKTATASSKKKSTKKAPAKKSGKKVSVKKVAKKTTKKTSPKKLDAVKASSKKKIATMPSKKKKVVSKKPKVKRVIARPMRPKRIRVSDRKRNVQYSDAYNAIHGIAPYKAATGERYMNDDQLDHFEAILLSWKAELMQEVDRTMHHMQDEASNFPDPTDRATQESEFGLELRTRDRERKLIKKIDSALKRIEEGEYGYCEETGEEIGLKRLEARPVATLSVEAQERRELAERQYRDSDDRYR